MSFGSLEIKEYFDVEIRKNFPNQSHFIRDNQNASKGSFCELIL